MTRRFESHRRAFGAVLVVAVAVAVAAIAGGAEGVIGGEEGAGAETSSGVPGVTASQITVGAVSTLTGPISAAFDGFVPGMQAYFKMVDAEGGVDGRKIVLPTTLSKNTASTASSFTSLAKTLVEQDHVFAMAVSTYVGSSPGFLGQTTTPTYGFNANGNWTGPPNLFAYGGSVLFYTSLGPQVSYLMKKTGSKRIGILAYDVAGSSPACTATGKILAKNGIDVAFENLHTSYGSSYTSTVQRMRSAGVQFVLSCMQDRDNVTLSRDMDEYGLGAKQLWLTGGGQALIDKYPSLMTGVYMTMSSVPFAAPTKYYPGLAKYLASMRKYAPGYVGTQVAIRGWASGALLVAGIRAAGKDLTQRRVVHLTNELTSFTATTLTAVVHWNSAHTKAVGPWCPALVQVKHRQMAPVYGEGHQVFTCFNLNDVKNPAPVAPPPGTPGTT
jgi:branched-chain amino acid transport system substrate-binding protein